LGWPCFVWRRRMWYEWRWAGNDVVIANNDYLYIYLFVCFGFFFFNYLFIGMFILFTFLVILLLFYLFSWLLTTY
jgi:hypothetical protein